MARWVMYGAVALVWSCVEPAPAPEYPQTPQGEAPMADGLPLHVPPIVPEAPEGVYLDLGPVVLTQAETAPERSFELINIAQNLGVDVFVRDASLLQVDQFSTPRGSSAPWGVPQQRGDEPRYPREDVVPQVDPVGPAVEIRAYRALRRVEVIPPAASIEHEAIPEHLREHFLGAQDRQQQLDLAYALFVEDRLYRPQYETMRAYLATF